MKTTNQNKEFSSPLKIWKIENKKHKNNLKKITSKKALFDALSVV